MRTSARPQTMTDYPPFPGYVGWFDADDPRTIQQTLGKVSTWVDKGSGLHNLTQATQATMPWTGQTQVGGRNALFFNAAQAMSGTRPVTAQPYTMFVAGQSTDAASNQRDIIIMHSNSGGDGRIFRSTTDQIGMAANVGLFPTVGPLLWGRAAHVVSAVANGASSAISVDDWPANIGNGGAVAPTPDTWSVGSFGNGTEFWKGYIAEIVIYASALTAINVQLVMAYLNAKWLGW